jgi:predicted helicase
VREWPGKLNAGLKGDKGVDLVAETRDKQLVAIQVKFRRDPNDPVTAPEVQKLDGFFEVLAFLVSKGDKRANSYGPVPK